MCSDGTDVDSRAKLTGIIAIIITVTVTITMG